MSYSVILLSNRRELRENRKARSERARYNNMLFHQSFYISAISFLEAKGYESIDNQDSIRARPIIIGENFELAPGFPRFRSRRRLWHVLA
jgi:hypothetical protein